MPSRKRKEDDPRALCAHLYPDDGIDPRDDKRRDARTERKADRKLYQLCKQVAQTLQLALGALPQAEVMAGVFVQEVRPAPHAGRLCALIAVPCPQQRAAVAAILERHSGRLRAEVAAAITRRRAPELTFEVIAESEQGGDCE